MGMVTRAGLAYRRRTGPGSWPWARLVVVLAGVIVLAGCGKGTLEVPANTPYFEEASLGSTMLGATGEAQTLPVLETRWLFLKKNPVAESRWHPVQVYTRLYRVRLNGGGQVWLSPNLRTDESRSRFRFEFFPRWGMLAVAGALAAALVALLAAMWRSGWLRRLFGAGPGGWGELLLAGALVWLARSSLLIAAIGWAGQQMMYPVDELQYFRIAFELLHGRSGEPWTYTVGQGLIHLPLVWLTGATSYYDIVWPISWLTGLVLAPASIVLTVCILRRLSGSMRLAAGVGLVWAVLPFCYLPFELAGHYKSIFVWPDFYAGHFTSWYIQTAGGFDGLSDVPSAVAVLGCMLLAMRLKPGYRYMAILGVCFSCACLIRINNIMFAPLLAYLMWLRMAPCYRSPSQVVWLGLTAAAAFIVVFLPQFLINSHQFGGWLRFPYVTAENRSAEGFAWDTFPHGVRYVVRCNLLYLVGAVTTLWFVRDRHVRTVLVLWTMPLILFFFGYPCVDNNPIRWFLTVYGALLSCYALTDVWRELPRKRAWALATTLGANVLLYGPANPLLQPHQWGFPDGLVRALGWVLPAVSAGLAIAICGCRWRPLAFAAMFLVLWHTAWSYGVLASMVALTARALIDAVAGCRQALAAASDSRPPGDDAQPPETTLSTGRDRAGAGPTSST